MRRLAALTKTVDRQGHCRRISGGIQREMSSTSGYLHDLFKHAVGCGIDNVGCADLSRHRETLLAQIDRDDGRAAHELGSHDCGEANGARAEHRDPCAGLRRQRVQYGAGPGLNAAAKRRECRERKIRRDLHHVADACDGVGREGGLPEEMSAELGATIAERRPTPTHAEHIDIAKIVAVAGRPALTFRAAATRSETHQHRIARREAGHAGADTFDDAGAFMTEYFR